jgi:hypothetical protein
MRAGYLEALAARTLGAAPVLRPATPSRFEPEGPAAGWGQYGAQAEPAGASGAGDLGLAGPAATPGAAQGAAALLPEIASAEATAAAATAADLPLLGSARPGTGREHPTALLTQRVWPAPGAGSSGARPSVAGPPGPEHPAPGLAGHGLAATGPAATGAAATGAAATGPLAAASTGAGTAGPGPALASWPEPGDGSAAAGSRAEWHEDLIRASQSLGALVPPGTDGLAGASAAAGAPGGRAGGPAGTGPGMRAGVHDPSPGWGAAPGDAPSAEPAIVVRIGRVDVRAVHTPAPPAPLPRARPQAGPSLAEYLRAQDRRHR